MVRVYIYDRPVSALERLGSWTPEGFLRARGAVTRSGVRRYLKTEMRDSSEANGSDTEVVGVHLPEEVLFSETAIDSIRLKPLTLDHPPAYAMVGRENISDLQVGTVGERWEKVDQQDSADKLLVMSMMITDEQTASLVTQGVRQLSLGYWADAREEAGDWNGTPYQYRFDAIGINHIAIVNAARVGPEARLFEEGKGVMRFFMRGKKEQPLWVRENAPPQAPTDGNTGTAPSSANPPPAPTEPAPTEPAPTQPQPAPPPQPQPAPIQPAPAPQPMPQPPADPGVPAWAETLLARVEGLAQQVGQLQATGSNAPPAWLESVAPLLDEGQVKALRERGAQRRDYLLAALAPRSIPNVDQYVDDALQAMVDMAVHERGLAEAYGWSQTGNAGVSMGGELAMLESSIPENVYELKAYMEEKVKS